MVALSACAFVAYAPVAAADPYTPVQTQDNADFAIADGYIVKQMGCTPDLSPSSPPSPGIRQVSLRTAGPE
jgi:hypothetical protein